MCVYTAGLALTQAELIVPNRFMLVMFFFLCSGDNRLAAYNCRHCCTVRPSKQMQPKGDRKLFDCTRCGWLATALRMIAAREK